MRLTSSIDEGRALCLPRAILVSLTLFLNVRKIELRSVKCSKSCLNLDVLNAAANADRLCIWHAWISMSTRCLDPEGRDKSNTYLIAVFKILIPFFYCTPEVVIDLGNILDC